MESGAASSFGLSNSLLQGITPKKDSLAKSVHPLEATERNYDDNVLQGKLDMISRTAGRGAALRLGMELKTTSSVGHFPVFSNRNYFSRDVILNRDSTMSFKDVLGQPENSERGVTLPHAILEKQFGLL
uniref:Proteasome maturation protein n=1 Tax=Caligus clemensi TaxID=344056 RepID=C1C2C8_CALCM|nr:Proteasome maturation protein [Caligus clemensi]